MNQVFEAPSIKKLSSGVMNKFGPSPAYARRVRTEIDGAKLDELTAQHGSPLYVYSERELRRRYREIEEASSSLRDDTGRDPDKETLAKALGITVEDLEKTQAQSAASMLLYLDHQRPDDSVSLRDTIIDQDPSVQPEAALEQREMLGTLRTAVTGLPETHAQVVERYYFNGEMLQDIAKDLGVTQARVSQIRSEALTSLRAWFGTLQDVFTDVDLTWLADDATTQSVDCFLCHQFLDATIAKDDGPGRVGHKPQLVRVYGD